MNELYIPLHSPLHGLDARVKLVLTLAFLIFLGLSPFKAWTAYLSFYFILLAAELLSRLGPGFFLKRALLALPFVLAALPLIFTGPPPLTIVSLPAGISLSISPEGSLRFFSLAFKAWISVQAAILLAATTRFPDLLSALRALKTPALFVAVIGLMGRYLAVIINEARSMMQARASRSPAIPHVRGGGSIAWRARVTGGMAGGLLLRSLERSDRLYAAMLSRGYNGDLPARVEPGFSSPDLLVLAAGLVLMTVLFISTTY